MAVSVVVAESRGGVRQGLSRLIEADPGYRILAVAGDGYAALRLAEALRPRLVVTNPVLDRLSGLDLARAIGAMEYGPAVLGLGDSTDPVRVAEFLDAGAAGYLPFSATRDELFEALALVARGGRYLHPTLGDLAGELLRVGGGYRAYPPWWHEDWTN